MSAYSKSIVILILAVAVSFPCAAGAATQDEARQLVHALSRTFSWTERPEILALLVDADARVAFHKIRDGRPLRASDPEWRSHYSAFHKEYAEAFMNTLQPITWSSPEAERPLTQTLASGLSSADAKVVLDFLESDELKTAVRDPQFQITWLRLMTFIPRFQEHELDVIFSADELQELRGSTGALMAKYPHAFQTLAPFHYSGRHPAIKRFTSLWAQWTLPGASPSAQQGKDAACPSDAAAGWTRRLIGTSGPRAASFGA